MSVAVVIVNWNSGILLEKCLTALSRQTVKLQHILVVDNASSDDSAAYTKLIAEASLLQMPTNLGFAAANNRALNECDTEFVALLNPDAFPAPDWLERLIAAAHTYPNIAAFGSRQLCENNPEVLDGIGDNYHITGLVWRNRSETSQITNDVVPKPIFSPCAAAALYRRQALIDVGGFDQDYFCYVEDVDLGFRLRLAGHKAMYVPDAVVHHVGSATTGGQQSDFSVYHGHRNLVWTFVKNMPGALFWLLLPLHILLNFVTIAWFIARGQGGVILRAKRDAIKGLPEAWAKRKRIQADRVASVSEIWRALDKRLVTAFIRR